MIEWLEGKKKFRGERNQRRQRLESHDRVRVKLAAHALAFVKRGLIPGEVQNRSHNQKRQRQCPNDALSVSFHFAPIIPALWVRVKHTIVRVDTEEILS